MPVVGTDEKVDFLRRQVLTSRNIGGSVLTDLALGGLNYQIEHHLFPSMPRPSLHHAQAPVREFCAQHSITYTQTGLLASYTRVLRHLHTTAQAAGPEPTADTAAAGPEAALNPAYAEHTVRPPRRRQAHTDNNESLPRRSPASPGNQPVQRSRP
jgi:fatty acid desaturase